MMSKPFGRTRPPCWWCRWWGGPTAGTAALCRNPACSRVRSQPDRGRSCYELEPGADSNVEWTPVAVIESPAVWAPSLGPPGVGPIESAP
jgi:hypothetical protein